MDYFYVSPESPVFEVRRTVLPGYKTASRATLEWISGSGGSSLIVGGKVLAGTESLAAEIQKSDLTGISLGEKVDFTNSDAMERESNVWVCLQVGGEPFVDDFAVDPKWSWLVLSERAMSVLSRLDKSLASRAEKFADNRLPESMSRISRGRTDSGRNGD